MAGLLIEATGARAQGKVFRIGILGGASRTSAEAGHLWDGFFEGLRERGYVEGRNFVVVERTYGQDLGRLPAMAAELVELRVDVIVAGSQPAPEVAREATTTIPIVLFNHSDPVASLLVASLAKPGGNVTGMSLNQLDLRSKQVQYLKEAVPTATSVSVLTHPSVAFQELDVRAIESAAKSLSMETHVVKAASAGEMPDAIATASRRRNTVLLVLGSPLYFVNRAAIAELAAKHRVAAMYGAKEFPEAGGLMSYGVNFRETARQAAGYVAKILGGANAGELPIEQPGRIDFVINLKAATALGLTIPPPLLARANEIIR